MVEWIVMLACSAGAKGSNLGEGLRYFCGVCKFRVHFDPDETKAPFLQICCLPLMSFGKVNFVVNSLKDPWIFYMWYYSHISAIFVLPLSV